MKRMPRQASWLIFLLSVSLSSGCESNPASPSTPPPENGSWTIYTPYDWPHDGRPYQSIYFTIYSDAADTTMKQQLGEIADERFSQILRLFDFENLSDFVYPPGYSKMEIYINRNHTENINWAYWGGFIITIRSSEITGRWHGYTVYTVRHELTHEFEFLIHGRESLATDVWFREGIAVYVGCAEYTGWDTIGDLSELESWISRHENMPGQGNPVRIHQHADFPDGADRHQYYRMFELAMRYILDDRGMGKSYQDVLSLFYDLRDGVSFPVSFENRFGIGVSDFEDEVFDRIGVYLSNSAPEFIEETRPGDEYPPLRANRVERCRASDSQHLVNACR
jgi:hypothetical protein